MTRKTLQPEIRAGIFVSVGCLLVMTAIVLLGGFNAIFSETYILTTKFHDVSGLTSGSRIQSGGIVLGRVTAIEFGPGYEGVVVTMQLDAKFKNRIKTDSKARILTQGVLGDKFLNISTGSETAQPAPPYSILPSEDESGISKMLKGSENVIALLEANLANIKVITDSFAKDKKSEVFFQNLSESVVNLNAILGSMRKGKGAEELSTALKNLRILTDRLNNGEGTVGALLNDSTLYEDLKLLIGGASRNKILRFFVHQAVKTGDEKVKDDIKKEKDKKAL